MLSTESSAVQIDPSCVQSWWNAILDRCGNDKYTVMVYGTFGVFFVAYWITGLIFSYVDLTGRPTFMAKYKIQENVKSYPLSRVDFVDLLKVVLINQCVILVALPVAFEVDKVRPLLSIDAEVPSLPTLVVHLLCSLLIMEVLLYYFHRLLHYYPPLYKRFHKKHHTWVSPVAISAIYCHPVEQVVLNVVPNMAGPFILSSHILIFWTWIILVVVGTLVTHSGYHLPFLLSSELHDYHHLRSNCNFGALGLMDRLHGTDLWFRNSKASLRHRMLWTLKSAKEMFP